MHGRRDRETVGRVVQLNYNRNAGVDSSTVQRACSVVENNGLNRADNTITSVSLVIQITIIITSVALLYYGF